MSTTPSGFYERDEPEFDLGFGLDPVGQIGDDLDRVVTTVNGLQETADTTARGQIARIQTALNLVQNNIRRDIDSRIDGPSTDLVEIQERIAVDSAGRMADAGERFNSFVRKIADNDDAYVRCLVACRAAIVECMEKPDSAKPAGRAECEQLLMECLARCRGEAPPPVPERPPLPERPMPEPPIKPPAPGRPGRPERIESKNGAPHTGDIAGGQIGLKPGQTDNPSECSWANLDHYGNLSERYRGRIAITWIPDQGTPTPTPLENGLVGVGVRIGPSDEWDSAPGNGIFLMRHCDRRLGDAVPWGIGHACPTMITPVCESLGIAEGEIPELDIPPDEPEYDEETPEEPACIPICPPAEPTGEPACALYFDCELKQVYGLLIPAGAEPEPRHEEDIQIGTTGVNEARFDELLEECEPREFDDEDDEEDEESPEDIGPGTRPGPDTEVQLCSEIQPATIFSGVDYDAGALCSLFGIGVNSDGTVQSPAWLTELPTWAQYIFEPVVSWLHGVCNDVTGWVGNWLTASGCGTARGAEIVLTRWLVYIVSLLAGRSVENWENTLRQNFNYDCPSLVPTADNAIEAFLANNITEHTAECWVRANNYRWNHFEHVLKARRSKLGVHELIQLRLRQSLTPGEFDERIRQLGFLTQDEPAAFMELSKWVPGPQDLIRWMVRDVEDIEIVNRFRLNDDFDSKFAGNVEKYADWQNIDEQDMLRMWRAHWLIPSPQQLYQMYHRLRHADIPDNERVTLDDIKTALKQQDIAPFWIDRHLAVSFRPLTRVDVRRAFRIGALDRAQAERAYYDLGYSNANATILVDFAEQLVTNTWLKTPWVTKLAAGELNEAEARGLMADEGAQPVYINKGVARADVLRAGQTRKKCLASLRKRFLEGEFTKPQANAEVVLIGVDAAAGNTIVDGWECELVSQGKHAPAAALCDWWMSGVIDGAEYYDRLLNLGYEHDTATNFMAQCSIKNDIRIEKAEKARIKQEAAARKKLQSAEEKQARIIEQQQKAARRRQDNAAKVRQRRQDLLVESAKRLANRFDDDIVLTMREVKTTHNAMKSLLEWREADIIKAIVQASQLKDLESLPQYGQAVLGILQELPVPGIGSNGNGQS